MTNRTDRKKCSSNDSFLYKGEGSHLNSLWSIWYGIFGTLLQSYVAIKCTRRLLKFGMIPWTEASAKTLSEFHLNLMLTGISVLIFPLFFVSSLFKVGNNANDGVKLGRNPMINLLDSFNCQMNGWVLEGFWKHGGPVAPLLHMISALCLLVPKLLMETRLIDAGYLPLETIWKTDVDFLMNKRDHLIVLSFMSDSEMNSSKSILKLSTTNSITSDSISNNTKPIHLPFNMMQTFNQFVGYKHEHNSFLDDDWTSIISIEYINYFLAILVYSIRYPSVFWYTNKRIGAIFSIQMLLATIQNVFIYNGIAILYKTQLIGINKVMPQFNGTIVSSAQTFVGSRVAKFFNVTPVPFILTPYVTLTFFSISFCILLLSSLILYFYGYTRLNIFINREQDCKMVVLRSNETYSSTSSITLIYFSATLLIITIGTVNIPLIHDFLVIYHASNDQIILFSIVITIVYFIAMIITWFYLIVKQKWHFKLGLVVDHNDVTSVKLITGPNGDSKNLLVIGAGDNGKVKSKNKLECNEEQIYWLHSAISSMDKLSESASKRADEWPKNSKSKVGFSDLTTSSFRRKGMGNIKFKTRNGETIIDDGDYATLRELPIILSMNDTADDSASEEGKLLACMQDESITYASTSRDLEPPNTYSSQISKTILEEVQLSANTIQNQSNTQQSSSQGNITTNSTPRCLRRTDSGMPHEELTPRSDSISTNGSSPPEVTESNTSESSSGVHSNASSEMKKNHLEICNQQFDNTANKVHAQINAQNYAQINEINASLNNRNSYINVNHNLNNLTQMNNAMKTQPNTQMNNGQMINVQMNSAQMLNVQMNNAQMNNTQMISTQINSVNNAQINNGQVNNSQMNNAQLINAQINSGQINNAQMNLMNNMNTQINNSQIYQKQNGSQINISQAPSLTQINTSHQSIYGIYSPQYVNMNNIENNDNSILQSTESTVVIRHTQPKPVKILDTKGILKSEETFGRSTNMKMISFRDELRNTQASSVTLPHYPTQQTVQQEEVYPHCSTMPIIQHTTGQVNQQLGSGSSYGAFPRQHTTIPTELNGVRLYTQHKPFIKKFPAYLNHNMAVNSRNN